MFIARTVYPYNFKLLNLGLGQTDRRRLSSIVNQFAVRKPRNT